MHKMTFAVLSFAIAGAAIAQDAVKSNEEYPEFYRGVS